MKRLSNKPGARRLTVSNQSHKDNKMTPETQVVADNEILVKRSLFDLSKFERASVEKKITFVGSKTMAEALERAGNDETKLLEVINAGERREAISEAKQSLGSDNLVSPKAVSTFVNGFKPLYKLKADTKEARAEQRAQIYAFIRSNPAILEAIKAAAVALNAVDDDEDGNDTTDTE